MSSLRDGVNELYVLSWPQGEGTFHHGLCMVVMRRQGGILLAVPPILVPVEALQGVVVEEGISVGLHTSLTVSAVAFEGELTHVVGQELDVLVMDVSDGILPHLVTFATTEIAEEAILGFAEELSLLPDPVSLLQQTKEWVEAIGAGTDPAFYSLRKRWWRFPSQKSQRQRAKQRRPKRQDLVERRHRPRSRSRL